MYVDSNLSQLVTEPTRMRPGQRSAILDLILTNDKNFLTPPETTSPLGLSDHVILTTTLQYTPEMRTDTSFAKKCYMKANFFVNKIVGWVVSRDVP